MELILAELCFKVERIMVEHMIMVKIDVHLLQFLTFLLTFFIKTQEPVLETFNAVEEHRQWCPWIIEKQDSSSDGTKDAQLPGWKRVLVSLLDKEKLLQVFFTLHILACKWFLFLINDLQMIIAFSSHLLKADILQYFSQRISFHDSNNVVTPLN